MCGVAGILRFDGAAPDGHKLVRMTESLVHRGPDGFGHELLGPCALGHRRLSIIDLTEAGHQPMVSADGRYWMTFNGEIYNYLELREDLKKLGHIFRTQTDSEVLLTAFLEWGTESFRRFNGMWGLAIWDLRERTLTLSRDRFGIKPLYVHANAKRLLFASEMKAFFAAEPDLADLDDHGVARFLRYGDAFRQETIFRDIRNLRPGTFEVHQLDGSIQTEAYWKYLPSVGQPRSLASAAEELRALLIDALKLRFRSDVPVGTCLSGGIDSTSLVSLAVRELGEKPRSFSAIYHSPGYDESHFVRNAVSELGIEGFEVLPDGSDFPEVIEKAVYHQDGPFNGPGIYSQWKVMDLAAGKVKVLIDGQGADELFAGYVSSFDTYVRGQLQAFRAGDLAAGRALAESLSTIEEISGKNPLRDLVRGQVKSKVGTARKSALRLLGRFGVTPDVLSALRGSEPAKVAPPLLARRLSDQLVGEGGAVADVQRKTTPLGDLLWDQLIASSIPALLHYEDRDSMAFSLEARTPFLDHRIVEFANSLPNEVRIHRGMTKAVLREGMRGTLPEAVRLRKDKLGYPTPGAIWFRGRLKDWVRDLTLSDGALERGFAERAGVEHLFSELEAGTDRSSTLR